MKYSTKRFETHVKALSTRFNLQESNILVYAKNNNLSDTMIHRLLDKFHSDAKAI